MIFHNGTMRGDAKHNDGTPDVAIHLVDPAAQADDANAFFDHAGLGRPVRGDEPNAQLQLMAFRVNGVDNIFGAAFAVSPGQVAESLILHGMTEKNASFVAIRIVALEAVFVATRFRGREYGRALIDAVEARARAAGAEYLVARVEATASGLHRLYRSLDFTVKSDGDSLTVEGVPMPRSVGYVDAVKVLVKTPTIMVH